MFGDDTKIKIVFTKKGQTDKIVKTITKLWVPLMAKQLLNIQATVSLLETAVYCEVWIPHFGKEFTVFSL
jgi:predicted transcriptional regulator YdeE